MSSQSARSDDNTGAGDVITLSVGATSSQTDDSIDKQVSGRHIITTLRHEFNLTGDPRHQMYMETIKDGLVDGFRKWSSL